MAKTRKHPDTARDAQQRDAMAAALVGLRHAAEASTPPHYRSAAWQQAIAKADAAINAHFNPQPGD